MTMTITMMRTKTLLCQCKAIKRYISNNTTYRDHCGEERRPMARNSEPIIISSVEFDYVGTSEQFNAFIKAVVKDYISENNLLPDEEYYLEKSA